VRLPIPPPGTAKSITLFQCRFDFDRIIFTAYFFEMNAIGPKPKRLHQNISSQPARRRLTSRIRPITCKFEGTISGHRGRRFRCDAMEAISACRPMKCAPARHRVVKLRIVRHDCKTALRVEDECRTFSRPITFAARKWRGWLLQKTRCRMFLILKVRREPPNRVRWWLCNHRAASAV
jgi:hypothetical protein